MKKALAIVFTLALVFSLAAVAFADIGPPAPATLQTLNKADMITAPATEMAAVTRIGIGEAPTTIERSTGEAEQVPYIYSNTLTSATTSEAIITKARTIGQDEAPITATYSAITRDGPAPASLFAQTSAMLGHYC